MQEYVDAKSFQQLKGPRNGLHRWIPIKTRSGYCPETHAGLYSPCQSKTYTNKRGQGITLLDRNNVSLLSKQAVERRLGGPWIYSCCVLFILAIYSMRQVRILILFLTQLCFSVKLYNMFLHKCRDCAQ